MITFILWTLGLLFALFVLPGVAIAITFYIFSSMSAGIKSLFKK